MKKILCILLIMALLISSISVGLVFEASAAEAVPANLIVNGDFEAAGVPSRLPSPYGASPAWTSVSDFQKWFRATPGTDTVNSSIITDPSNPSNKILKVMQNAACGVTVQPNNTYLLTFSAKADYAFERFRVAFYNVTASNTNYQYGTDQILYPIVSASGTKTYISGGKEVVEEISPCWKGVDHCIQIKLDTDKWATYKILIRLDTALSPSQLGAIMFYAKDYSDSTTDAAHAAFYLDNVSLQQAFTIISGVEEVSGKVGGYLETPEIIKAVTGQSVTVKAVPYAGSTFLGWYSNDTLVSTNAEYTFNVTGHATFLAKFSNPQHTYIPPSEITSDDIIADDPNLMISFPHYGTPGFAQPGGQIKAEVRAPARFGTDGWSAWVENEFRRWDCTVGTVTYGENNVYMGMKAGYVVPITLPADVTPELLTLVIRHKSGLTLRSPMSLSVVPNLNASFYTMSLTDTHLGWNNDSKTDGVGAPTAWGLMCQALKVTGIRFLSHTGDIELYPLESRAEGIKGMIIDKQLEYSGYTIPFVHAAGNHEYDPYIQPTNNIEDGTKTGDFGGTDNDRFFGRRSAIIPMGSFLVAKHDFMGHPKISYWGDRELRNAFIAEWNTVAGNYKYRLMFEHSHANGRAIFKQWDQSDDAPVPSILPTLELKGHDHFWGVNQNSPYRVISLGGGTWQPGSGALVRFNYSETGTWSSPFDTSFSQNDKFQLVADYANRRVKIRENYQKANNGTATSNSCTIENDINFNFFDGRVRFVMAKGNYRVTGGTKLSQYDSADGTKTIVLAKVNIPANGSVTVSILENNIPPGEERIITLDSQGGSAIPPMVERVNTQIEFIPEPVKDGYDFVGWYTDPTGGTKITFPYTVTDNVTLYARWAPKTFTVTFNSNGGSAVQSQTVENNGTINEPTPPTRDGYVFKCWSTEQGTKVNFPLTVTSNMNLIAIWVSESGNMLVNGDFETPTGYTSQGVSNRFRSPQGSQWSTIADYQQWFRASLGNDKIYSAIIADPYNPGNNIAKVMQTALQGVVVEGGKTYKLTFSVKSDYAFNEFYVLFSNINDAPTNPSYPDSYKIVSATGTKTYKNGDTTVTESVNVYNESKKCIHINPLNIDKWVTYEIVLTLDTLTPPPLTAIQFRSNDFSSTVGDQKCAAFYLDNVSLEEYTQSVETYTVTFDSQGGSTVAPVTVAEGTAIDAPTAPTKAGYVFDGWYTEPDGGQKVTFPYTVTGNIVLYAHWVEATSTQYTVTFDSQGGSTVAPVTVAEGTAIDAPTAPTKAGFAFDGWYTEPQGGEKVTFPYTVTQNVTLYARWTAANLIANGDFETDTGFNYQVPNRFDSPQGKDWTTFEDFHKWLRASLGNETIHSKIITDPENPNNRIASIMQTALQSVAVEDGKTYVLRFSAKGEYAFKQFAISIVDLSTATSTPVYDERVFPIVSATGTKSYYDNGTLVTEEFDPYDAEGQRLLLELDTDKWVTYEIEFTLGEGMDPQLIYAILFRCDDYSGTPGDPSTARVYMDNVSLEEVPEPTYTPGDINDDGKIDLKDVTALSRHIAGWSGIDVVEAALDVNGDKKIDLKDVTQLARYIAGWDVEIY